MSAFDLQLQQAKVESKIVVALERISEAFRVLLWNEAKSSALSPIQIQILIFLLFHPRERCKVSFLAGEFNMTKATISDSVKILEEKNFIKKEGDDLDTRSYVIVLTAKGRKAAEKASFFTSAVQKPLEKLSADQKKMMLDSLLRLICELNRDGIITVQRMCFTCANYRFDGGIHYCRLLQSELATDELRVDCPEHQPAGAICL